MSSFKLTATSLKIYRNVTYMKSVTGFKITDQGFPTANTMSPTSPFIIRYIDYKKFLLFMQIMFHDRLLSDMWCDFSDLFFKKWQLLSLYLKCYAKKIAELICKDPQEAFLIPSKCLYGNKIKAVIHSRLYKYNNLTFILEFRMIALKLKEDGSGLTISSGVQENKLWTLKVAGD